MASGSVTGRWQFKVMVAFLALVFGFATVLRVLFWMATHPLSWYKKKDRSGEQVVVSRVLSRVLSGLQMLVWVGVGRVTCMKVSVTCLLHTIRTCAI